MVVVQNPADQVVRVISSPREKVSNVRAIDDAFIEQHRSLIERYRPPDYTVFTVRSRNMALVEASFPGYSGWETAQREQLAMK